MTERKWTPGPWFVDTPAGEDRPWIKAECNHTLDDNGVENYMSVSGLCGMENAHLIASAPDLYEALEWLADHADDSEASRDDNWYERLEKARAALSKARGEVK